jgi:hypothetical protein
MKSTDETTDISETERIDLIIRLMNHPYTILIPLYPKLSKATPLLTINEEDESFRPLSLYEESLLVVGSNWQFFSHEEKMKLKTAPQQLQDDVKFMAEELIHTRLS